MDDWTELNRQRVGEAMKLLYETYIVDAKQAQARGTAIQALDALLVALGGEVLSSKIEAVPYSKRLRESGEPELVELETEIRKKMQESRDA